MYPNLEAEMARYKVKREDIALEIGKSSKTVGLKLSGRTPFTIDEAFIIKRKFFPDCNVEALFKREEH